ncbi:capping protein inhibiting regulator of actin dynamics isoform X1 [Lampris incognitus]|uniref:capping protein inhibiting regulator of actin dynamics isoform X1 n=1 Tax=Lampris incognitus TaxID=2546036 RepID=UPI0024B55F0A|nr:capping protein inhibiting regulator of actin dynamics isoform X1 [Lampris incognitus]
MSQENVSDKVRSLQRQIAQSIKFGQKPPSQRKSEGDEDSSDEEEVPRSPIKLLAHVEAESGQTEPKVQGAQPTGTHSTPVKSPRSKRVLPPTGTIESINLDAVPQSVPRLDNTAAKHKLSVKPKNQRISRKHRRFTQELQEVSVPSVLQEDLEAAGISTDSQHRTAADEPYYESQDISTKQRLHEEDRWESKGRRELEEQRLRQEEEEHMRRAEEVKLHELEEERCRKQEEDRIHKEEKDRRHREEEKKRIQEEERRRREEEEQTQREEEERIREEQECQLREKEERICLEDQRRKEEEERKKREEERRQQELEAEHLRLEEKRFQEESEEEERQKKLEIQRQRTEERRKLEAEEKKKKEEEEQKRLSLEETDGSLDPQERKRRAEELRWREMEERQRPFSFKVSSGEKQILFQKVNLTPVTPVSGHQGGAVSDQQEGTKASSPEGPESPNLPSSQYVPHTAILVTGAQLCGTAVNLDQIKDTACKSLLGLGEDKKALSTPPTKSKTSPDRMCGKTKSLNESSLSTDQSSAAMLAEWASIRLKIFKGAEEGKYEDYPDLSRNNSRPSSENLNQSPFSHTNLRKTMSASAKFSITPANKKFGDSNRNSEFLSPEDKEGGKQVTPSDSHPAPPVVSLTPVSKAQNRTSKTVRIADRGSEECMFAKDLPSFLVPSPGTKPEGEEMKGRSQGEAEDIDSREQGEEKSQDSDDKPSPFGIKLRRTNYSLRFHSEQSIEKRKKRYSAGDSFDGVPSPLTPIEPDSDASSVFSDKSSPTSPQNEGRGSKFLHAAASPAIPRSKPGKLSSAAMHSESEKVLSKPPFYQRPTTSPKPSGAVTTPPPSPLPKVVHRDPGDAMAQRSVGATDLSSQEQADKGEESSAVAQLHRSSQGQTQGQGEDEPKEKRSFFPSINIPWREKVDRKTELIKREKPSLHSRHSLDSARVQEKETGPLWITLALQKQRGFREQQQSREERRSQREAKLAEKQSKEKESATLVSPSNSKGNGSTSPSKPQTAEEPKRPDSLLGRFERRDHLKKANTLPSSVTVEIADSTPSPPAVKDVSKRFPSSDSPQVSTEPAWLALAKRKAKAWSDCPQIIK